MLEAMQSAVIWYLALALIAFLTLPVVFHTCSALPDRGLSLIRPFGLIVVCLPVWWLGHLISLPFSRTVFVIVLLLIGVASWAFAIIRGGLVQFVIERRRRIIVLEVASAILFFGYVMLRGYNPVAYGTEKPMEMAFLNASIVSDRLPVQDPWFAGEPINYYYFGYAVLGLLAKLTSLSGGLVFNLGLATTFALATVAAAGTAANLYETFSSRARMSPAVPALLGGFLLMVSGNLHTATEFVRSPGETVRAGWWDGVGWGASRIVVDTGFAQGGTRTVITEFPAFSWVLGDLHPHVLAYPWLILGLGLVFNLFLTVRSAPKPTSALLPAASIGIVLAVLYSANTWDVPVVALLTVAALVSLASSTGVRTFLVPFGVVGSVAVLAALPFALDYTAAAGDPQFDSGALSNVPVMGSLFAMVGWVDWDRSSARELFLVHGGFLLLLGIVLAGSWNRLAATFRSNPFGVMVTITTLIVLGALLNVPALALFGIPWILLVWLMADASQDAGRWAATGLMAAAIVIVLAVEFVFVRDPFGDRMNSVFKLYFQVWAMLAIALGALIPESLARMRESAGRNASRVALMVTGLILLSTAVYLPLSAYRWFDEFDNWRSLDALAYLDEVQPAEGAAIEWLIENADSNSVVLEAPGCSYGTDNRIPHSRISMATGLPAVIGWDGHQYQWRRQQTTLIPEIGARIAAVSVIYDDPTSTEAQAHLVNHGVDYIVVGVHEINGYARCEHGPPYSPAGLAALGGSGWEMVFEREGVQIYERVGGSGTN